MTDIKVNFAGVEVAEPYEGYLTIYYIPDQNQNLIAGQKYRLIIDGFTFKQVDTSKKG